MVIVGTWTPFANGAVLGLRAGFYAGLDELVVGAGVFGGGRRGEELELLFRELEPPDAPRGGGSKLQGHGSFQSGCEQVDVVLAEIVCPVARL